MKTKNVLGVLLSFQDDFSTNELECASAQPIAMPMPHENGPELYHRNKFLSHA
jgi:hypothetical protein